MNESGHASMVDVSDKPITQRGAVAQGEYKDTSGPALVAYIQDTLKGEAIETTCIADEKDQIVERLRAMRIRRPLGRARGMDRRSLHRQAGQLVHYIDRRLLRAPQRLRGGC